MWRGWMDKDGLYRPYSPEGKRKRGRPQKNWEETKCEDIQYMDMTWSEAIDLAEERDGWKDCVARCAAMH